MCQYVSIFITGKDVNLYACAHVWIMCSVYMGVFAISPRSPFGGSDLLLVSGQRKHWLLALLAFSTFPWVHRDVAVKVGNSIDDLPKVVSFELCLHIRIPLMSCKPTIAHLSTHHMAVDSRMNQMLAAIVRTQTCESCWMHWMRLECQMASVTCPA